MNIQRACQYHTKNQSQQQTNMTKSCILPKFTPPLHPKEKPSKNYQNSHQKQAPNPIQPPKKHLLTIQLEESHVLQLQTHWHGTWPSG